jgi:hypothetical protein
MIEPRFQDRRRHAIVLSRAENDDRISPVHLVLVRAGPHLEAAPRRDGGYRRRDGSDGRDQEKQTGQEQASTIEPAPKI